MVVEVTGPAAFAAVPDTGAFPSTGALGVLAMVGALAVLGRLGSATEMIVVVGVGVDTVVTPVLVAWANATPCMAIVRPNATTPAHVDRIAMPHLPRRAQLDRIICLLRATNVPSFVFPGVLPHARLHTRRSWGAESDEVGDVSSAFHGDHA